MPNTKHDNLSDVECEFCGERPGIKLHTEGGEKYWVCNPCVSPDLPEANVITDGSDGELTYAQSMAWFGEVL